MLSSRLEVGGGNLILPEDEESQRQCNSCREYGQACWGTAGLFPGEGARKVRFSHTQCGTQAGQLRMDGVSSSNKLRCSHWPYLQMDKGVIKVSKIERNTYKKESVVMGTG